MRARQFLWLLIVPSLLFVFLIWFDVLPWLRGPEEWRWSLRAADQPAIYILLPIAGLLLYVVVCVRWLSTFETTPTRSKWRSAEWGLLLFLMFAAPLIQILLAAAVWRSPLFELFANTTSPSVTGFYSVAVTTPNLPSQLTNYTTLMPTLPIHPSTHPPGLVLAQWLGWQFFEALPTLSNVIAMPPRMLQCHNVPLMTLDNPQIASASIGMLVPIIGGLAVWPMYALGRRLVGSKAAAVAVSIFPVLPMFAMWPSQFDQVYPLLLFAGLYLIHRGIESGSNGRVLASGLVLSLATFLSVGNAMLIVIVALYGLLQLIKRGGQHWIRLASAFALGCLTIWLWYVVTYQVSLSDLASLGFRLLSESTRCPTCPSTTRSYDLWLLWNPIDFAIFLSIPLAVLLLQRLVNLAAYFRRFPKRDYPEWGLLAIAAGVPLLVWLVSGIVRGEVSRLWAYFGPLLIFIVLAPIPGRSSLTDRSRNVAVLIGLIGLQLIVMNTRWQPYPSFMNEPPVRQADFSEPKSEYTSNASFNQEIALTGYTITRYHDTLDLEIDWQALSQPLHDYTVFVHVLDANGQLIAQQDNMPIRDQLPTACWQPNEYVTDPYSLPIPRGAQQPLSIELGLYQLDTGERLSLDDGTGAVVKLTVP